jgi:hypothetical protein
VKRGRRWARYRSVGHKITLGAWELFWYPLAWSVGRGSDSKPNYGDIKIVNRTYSPIHYIGYIRVTWEYLADSWTPVAPLAAEIMAVTGTDFARSYMRQ